MKIILAYNPFSSIKAMALNKFLGRGDITSTTLSSLASGSEKEQKAFEKATKFFERGNFLKHFEKMLPQGKGESYYIRIFEGTLMDLAKNEGTFDDFFGDKFSLDKIDDRGEYASFKSDCETTHLAGWLNDVLGIMDTRTFRDSMRRNSAMSTEVKNLVGEFQKGKKRIADFYNSFNAIVNKYSEMSEREITVSEAWSNIRKEHVLDHGGYSCYAVRRWKDLNAVANNTDWCVAQNGHSGQSFFDGERGYIYPNYDKDGNPTEHLSNPKNAYYLICKGTKPIALFNISTTKGYNQFKNTSDNQMSLGKPSAANAFWIGNELRKMLGAEDDYNGDFSVFKDFEECGDCVEKNWIEWENTEEWKDDPDLRQKFFEVLKHDNIWYVFVKNPALLKDKEIYNAVLECMRVGKLLEVLKYHPEFLRDERVTKVFLSKVGGFIGSVVQENPELFDRDDIRAVVVKHLKDGKIPWSFFAKIPSIFKYQDILEAYTNMPEWDNDEEKILKNNEKLFFEDQNVRKKAVETAIQKKGYSFVALCENIPFLLKDDTVRARFVVDVQGYGSFSEIISKNMWLLDYQNIDDAIIECLRKSCDANMIGHLHDFLDNERVRKGFCDVLRQNFDRFIVQPYAVKWFQYADLQAVLVENMKQGKGLDMVAYFPQLLQDKEIHAAIINGLQGNDDKGVEASKAFLIDLLDHNENLIKDDGIRQSFKKLIGENASIEWISEHSEYVSEAPDLLDIVKQYYFHTRNYYVIKKFPELLKDKEIHDELADAIRRGEKVALNAIKFNPLLLNDKGIYDAFLDLLDIGSGTDFEWEIVSEKPKLFQDEKVREYYKNALLGGSPINSLVMKDLSLLEDDGIRWNLVKYLQKGNGMYLFEHHVDLLEKYKDLLDVFLMSIKTDGSAATVVDTDYELLSCKPIYDEFVKHMERAKYIVDYIVSEHTELFDDSNIRSILIKIMSEGNMMYIERNPKLLKYKDVYDEFIKHEPDDTLCMRVCSVSNNQNVIAFCLNASEDPAVIQSAIENESKELDEDKHFEYSKKLAGTNYDCMESFLCRFEKYKDQNAFWSFICSSDYLFDLLQEHGRLFPDAVLEKLEHSEDDDVNWMARRVMGYRKIKMYSKDDSDKVANRVARRLALNCIIPLKIARESMR